MKCPLCENEKFVKINIEDINNPNIESYACTTCGYIVLFSKDAKSQYQAYKLKERRLNKVIKEKIQEHEYLTNHQGNYDYLDASTRKKAKELYNEIQELIDEYQEVSEKIYLKN